MLSYRHSYHAGNFADVIKHVVIIKILEHLIKKDAAFDYIDTHAGAGLYNLRSEHAEKLQEYVNGIARLKRDNWPELACYFDILDKYNKDGSLIFYPGSPLIAMHFLRSKDRAWLFELHSTDIDLLRKNTKNNKYVTVSYDDGYKGLLALVPPLSRRALVLLDPSYELKTDYAQVFNTVSRAYKKFPTGIYAIWYPVVDKRRTEQLKNRFIKSGIKKIHCYELGIYPATSHKGMTAAGMIVINSPWKLMEEMKTLLPRLHETLTQSGNTYYQCDVLVGE